MCCDCVLSLGGGSLGFNIFHFSSTAVLCLHELFYCVLFWVGFFWRQVCFICLQLLPFAFMRLLSRVLLASNLFHLSSIAVLCPHSFLFVCASFM